MLEELVSRAVELASKVEEDPHWRGLPDPEPLSMIRQGAY